MVLALFTRSCCYWPFVSSQLNDRAGIFLDKNHSLSQSGPPCHQHNSEALVIFCVGIPRTPRKSFELFIYGPGMQDGCL